MSCDKHPDSGTVILTDGTVVCYGCYQEQFMYCPLCGKIWDECFCLDTAQDDWYDDLEF